MAPSYESVLCLFYSFLPWRPAESLSPSHQRCLARGASSTVTTSTQSYCSRGAAPQRGTHTLQAAPPRARSHHRYRRDAHGAEPGQATARCCCRDRAAPPRRVHRRSSSGGDRVDGQPPARAAARGS